MPYVVFSSAVAVFLGGIVGTLGAKHIPQNIKESLPLAFSIGTMAMAIKSVMQTHCLPAVVAALLLGTVVGTVCRLEHYLRKWGEWMARKLSRGVSGANREGYLELFAIAVILFCTGATGIYGTMQVAISGDSDVLLTKAVLDVFTAVIFATTLGLSVTVLSLPMAAVFTMVFFIAKIIAPYLTPEMFQDFSGCGGVLLLATGLRMAQIKQYRVADMLPALAIVMPVSYFWNVYF